MFNIIYFPYLLNAVVHGAHPLMQVAEITESDLELYLDPSQILVHSQKNRAAFFPFKDPANQLVETRHKDENWVLISTECGDEASSINSEYIIGESTFTAEAQTVENGIHVIWKLGEKYLAEQLIMRRAIPCSIHILEADALKGPEIIVTWKFSPELKGITIYRIPDSAY